MEEMWFDPQQGQEIILFSKTSRSAMGATWFSFLWAEVTGVQSLQFNSISLQRLGLGGCRSPIPSDAILACRGTGLDFMYDMSLAELFAYVEVILRLHIHFSVQIVFIIVR